LSKITLYNTISKITGDISQVITYDRPIARGYERRYETMRKDNRESANEQNTKRARRQVHDIVNTNWTEHTKMITLTYRITELDYDQVANDFKTFRKNLNRKGYSFPYLTIIEHQLKRGKKENNAGSLHIHCIAFTDKYIPFKTLKAVWSRVGSVHIEKIDKAANKGAYVAKYITKDALPPDKKSYRTSRDIKRPTVEIGLYEKNNILLNTIDNHEIMFSINYSIKGAEVQEGIHEIVNTASGLVYKTERKEQK